MDNNTKPDNKDIPDNSSDQHLSPDETGDFTTPEELAEWAANIDECEPVGFFTGGNTFVAAQPEPQTQEQFDRKPFEVKLLNMGFTTEEIASMSDDELKETIEVNLNQEPEYVSGEETLIGESAFHTTWGKIEWSGYMYQEGQTHGLQTDSTVKKMVDDWYASNLLYYTQYLSTEAGFCGDREPSTSSSTSNGSGGTGITTTYYGAYIRLVNSSKNPTFECQNDSDLYTVASSSDGNRALIYPIGLISADEIVYAGGS